MLVLGQSAVHQLLCVRGRAVPVCGVRGHEGHDVLRVLALPRRDVRDDGLHTVHESRMHAVHDDLQRQHVRDDGVHGGGESRVHNLQCVRGRF